MQTNVKHSTRASVKRNRKIIGPKNFASASFALLAIALLTVIAVMSAYFIASYYGNPEAVLGFLDKFQLRDKFMEMFNKFNTFETRRFIQGYFAFSLMSFAFLLLFAPKKEKGNCSLYVIYTLATLVFVVYFTLAAHYPEASMVDLWKSMPELFKKPINEIFDMFLANVEYFIAVISVSVFAVNVMIASANRNFANSIMLDEHTELKKHLTAFPAISSKSVKKLVLWPTYWGLLFFFTAQVVLPVLFLDNAVIIGRVRLIAIVVSPLLNCLMFGMSTKKSISSYRMKNASVFGAMKEQADRLETVSSAPVITEQPVVNRFDSEHNKSMFWMREAKYWHSQAHNKQCFEDHYSNIINDFQNK